MEVEFFLVRNIFLHLHTLLRYRDCVLFSDNMSNEDTIYLGNMHNADAELQKKMNFMDFLRICRRTYFVEGQRDVVRECWTEEGHDKTDLEGDCSILQTWKLKCLRIWGKPAQKALIRNHSPIFKVARWPQELFDLLEQLNDKWKRNELLGQAKGKTKVVRGKSVTSSVSEKDMDKTIGQTYVTALSGLPEGVIKTLLNKCLSLKIPIAALKKEGLELKKKERFMAALNQMVGSDDNQQTYNKFGQQQIENMFAQFGAPFSKATKPPAGMQRDVTKMKNKRQRILKLKAQIEAGDVNDGEEQKLDEAENPDENDYIKTYKAIVLDGRNFRETDDPIGEYHLNLPSNQIRFVNDNVLDISDVGKLKADYDLILLDPPYGKTDQTWDQKAWGEEEFDTCFTSAMMMTTSKSFTIVSFCAAEQISTIMKVLRSKAKSFSDAPGDTKAYKGHVCEALWVKSGHRLHSRESSYLVLHTYRI